MTVFLIGLAALTLMLVCGVLLQQSGAKNGDNTRRRVGLFLVIAAAVLLIINAGIRIGSVV
ncbi:hypothetical protein HME9302_00159 [Alteripontixanthobacter maritimus]|uniref:Uncharacterized protein n=1 Tax=Alteripontixanthobacter maritimus TaxID=2161824 RepID=A0A369Q393_9SPHN|nr:hypothetical protein HME9302_00159 [Alteripontixanthobacter maritimus]